MFLYILQCSNGRYYIGSTTDLERRFAEHQRGKNKATKNLLPVQLKFSYKFPTLLAARQAEQWLKKQKDRRLIERIILEGTITI